MSLAAGTRLGPYEIVALLGAGGMGEVYKARDTRLDRVVAVKVLNSQITAGTDARERFEREARVISQLSHPHICPLFDVGEAVVSRQSSVTSHQSPATGEEALRFLVMEYLEGETLADRLQKTPLTLTETLRFGIEIASAMDAAHRQGVVHRDLKPGNVMITKAGAKLLDFGLAKVGAVAGVVSGVSMMPTTPPNLTAQGTIVGTFQYMSPEQLEGKEADARTDIFAFGALLFEMATGRKAFLGATQVSLIGAILKDTPVPVSSIVPTTPPALDFVIRKCLAKSSDDRWQSSRDLVSHLEWIAQRGSEAGASAVAPASTARARRAGARVAWAAAIVFAGAALTLGWLQFGRRAVPAAAIHFQFGPPAETTYSFGAAAPQLAISPDGRRIAFQVIKDQKQVLAVRALDSLQVQIPAGTDDALLPFWSPDSRFIAFFAGGKLKKIDVTGGPPQVLCNASAGEGGTWNSDGTILFAPSSNSGLFRVRAEGGEPAPVTTLDTAQKESSHRAPWFLPDGRHFIYFSGPGVAYVGALDSKDRVKLFLTESKAIFAGGHLLFIRQGTLLAQPFEAGRLETTGELFPVAENVAYNSTNGRAAFSASSNGVLTYRTGGSNSGLLAQLTMHDRGGRPVGDIGPPAPYMGIDISPDGHRIAAQTHLDPGGGDVWVIDAERGTNTRFTFDAGRHDGGPIWSPDGSRIAYVAPRGTTAIRQKASSGAGQDEPLVETPVGEARPTDWSRDGRFLLYQVVDPKTRSDVWALPLFGDRKPYPLLKSEFNESAASLSPDGRWIAYQSDESGRYEIYVQSFPSTAGKWQVSANGGGQARWRQDGKEMYFLGPDRKLMAADVRVEGANLKAGVPQALFDTRAPLNGGLGTNFFPYAVLGNGQRFVVSTTVKESESTPVTVVVNWTAALRK